MQDVLNRLTSAFIAQNYDPEDAVRMAQNTIKDPIRTWNIIGGQDGDPGARDAFFRKYYGDNKYAKGYNANDEFKPIQTGKGVQYGRYFKDENGVGHVQRMPQALKDANVYPALHNRILTPLATLGAVGTVGASMLPGRAEAAGLVGQIPLALAAGSDALTAGHAIGGMASDAASSLYDKFLRAKMGDDELYYGD